MLTRKTLVAILISLGFGAGLKAQSLDTAVALPRYPGIKTQFIQSLSQALTNEDKLDLFRQTVRQGRNSGEPMLKRKFGNFQPGTFNLSPSIPGLAETVRLLASDNRNVVRGNARALRYAMSLQSDARFNVEGLNRPRINSVGATDADIVFRHQQTGLHGRMEVKNMTPTSQRANLANIQSQLLKMAEDARLTGEIQVWANRQSVLPEVRDFAERHGIMVQDRLRTGNTNLRAGDRGFHDFANNLDKKLRLQARLTTVAGSVQAGMGIYMAYQAIGNLANDVAGFRGSQGELLRIGEHGSILLAGGGLSSAGVAQLIRQIPAISNSTRLVSISKWGGRFGVAGTVLAEGFLVGQYLSGDLTERQFWHGQSSLGGGLVAGAAGAWGGAKVGAAIGAGIGSFFPGPGTLIGTGIGAAIGAVGGGVGGGYAGSYFVGRGVDSLYRFQDAAQQERYAQFLVNHYQSR